MIKYSLILLLLFIFCIYCPAFSQTTINKQFKIVSQVDSLNQLAEKLRRSNLDSAFSIIEKSEKLATSISYKEGRGIALSHKSHTISDKGNYVEGLSIIEQAISILEKTSNKINLATAYGQRGYLKERLGYIDEALENYTKGLASLKSVTDSDISFNLAVIYNQLGAYYQRRGKYTESLKYFNDALVLSENQNEPTFTATCFNNIGNIHLFQQEYEKAIPYYEKSTLLRKKIGDRKGLASVYNNWGASLLSLEKIEEALPYLEEAGQIYQETGNTRGYLMSQTNIGLIHFSREEYDKAGVYFKACLKLENEITDKNTLSIIYVNLAAISHQQQKYDSAIVYAQKGLEVAKTIDAKNSIIKNLESLALSYKDKKDFEKAYEYQTLYIIYKDSLFNIEKTSEINSLLLDQKKFENIQLEKDNLLKNNALQKEQFERKTKEQEFNLLEKQAEADQLFALAREATSQKQADSLFRAAQNAQLEADNLKIKAEKTEAEQRAAKAESDQEIAFQRNLSILFGVIVLAAFIIIFVIYRNQRNKQKANLLLAEKNEEINLQNELLADSNQMKNRLFSIIAHDLRSPITAFQGITEQINFFLRKDKPERLLQMTDSIDASAQNLNHLLNNLLSWALTQTEQISLETAELNLYKNVEDVVKVYEMSALINQIELKSILSKDISIYADKDSFQTILRNLIGNAIKYTPEDGKITISAKPKNDKIILSIADTGTGMNEETVQKLFQLGVGNTSRGIRGEKGTGLGLVLCYEFAELNDIKIDVESKENQGTTFHLSIPIKS